MSPADDLRRHVASLSATVHVSDLTTGVVSLDLLAVPEELRGRGCARQALEEIARWADHARANVLLTATPALGARMHRLLRLYSAYGFVACAADGLGGVEMRRAPAVVPA